MLRGKGLLGFTADILANDKTMVHEKADLPVQAVMEYGVYHLTRPFNDLPNGNPETGKTRVC